jgi:flagellar hook-length control protein FliK
VAQSNGTNAVVKTTPGNAGQDATESALGDLPSGNAAVTAEAATTGGPAATSALSGETLLASHLAEAAHAAEDTAATDPTAELGAPTDGEANALAANGAPATNPTPTTAAASDAPPPRPAPALQPLLDQVLPALSEAATADTGGNFTIQLRPPELGKVQVNLKIDEDGHVTASIMADRQDTLSLLQRDSQQLEQALSDAGLTANNGDLQFSLSGDSQGTGFDESPGSSYNAGIAAAAAATVNESAAPAVTRQLGGLSLVDVHV